MIDDADEGATDLGDGSVELVVVLSVGYLQIKACQLLIKRSTPAAQLMSAKGGRTYRYPEVHQTCCPNKTIPVVSVSPRGWCLDVIDGRCNEKRLRIGEANKSQSRWHWGEKRIFHGRADGER